MSPSGLDLDALADVVHGAALQVRARDAERAGSVLHALRYAIPGMLGEAHGAVRLSAMAPLPDGPLLRLDDLPDDPLARRRIIDLVDELVAEAGLEPGSAVVLPVDGLAALDECPRAVVLRQFPAPAGEHGRIPPSWIDLAAEWVFGGLEPDDPVRLRVLGVELEVAARDAGGILHGCAQARAWCDAVTGELTDRIRTASISFGIAPHVALAAGGPRCDDAGLLARFDLLAEVALDAEDAAYVCLDFEETFADLGIGLAAATWPDEGGASPNRVAGSLADQAVPEAYPLQVVGRRLLDRLLSPPRRARQIDAERWLLTFGQPRDWLVDAELRPNVLADARERLRPVLLSAADLERALDSDRPEPGAYEPLGDGLAAPPSAVETAGRRDDGTGLPDLDAVVIEPGSHARRGMRLSVLELAAWLGGEPHSDRPESVSEVLRSYVRELGAGLDDAHRQRLRDVAAALVGTAPSDEDSEEARCWLLADRLLRVDAPAWLRAAGLTESADRLDRLGPVIEDTQLVRGVDLVGHAITTASRRLEITQAIAADHADEVDELAWEIWEETAERTGWRAAADTVGSGLPGQILFATDQRVMELSRDPDERAAVEASTRGLGDEIWTTGLHEIAATAWRDGWDAAEALVHHESTFSLRTTLRRSFETRATADDDPFEVLVEEIDARAKESIARLILVGDDQSDYWAKGVAAAVAVPGGDRFLAAMDDAREVLGPALFDEAIEAAQRQLAEWARRSPRLVSRAVVASVTREACSVAGRSVAARAAAEALAHGLDLDAAAEAARHAMSPLVDALADDAVELIGELVQIRS